MKMTNLENDGMRVVATSSHQPSRTPPRSWIPTSRCPLHIFHNAEHDGKSPWTRTCGEVGSGWPDGRVHAHHLSGCHLSIYMSHVIRLRRSCQNRMMTELEWERRRDPNARLPDTCCCSRREKRRPQWERRRDPNARLPENSRHMLLQPPREAAGGPGPLGCEYHMRAGSMQWYLQ